MTKGNILRDIIKYAMLAVFMAMVIVGGCKKKLPTQPQDNGNNEYTYPLNISNDELNSYGPNIAIDTHGRVYVLWFDAEGAKLKVRDENGEWGNTKMLMSKVWGHEIASDQMGNIHIILEKTHTDSSGAAHDSVFYVEIDSEGNMSDEIALNDEADVDQPVIAVDSLGGVHVMWHSETHGWLYRYRSPEGDWVWRDTLVVSYDNPFLYAKPDGSLVMIFSPGYRIIYRERPAGGRWGQDEFVDTSDIAVFSWWGSCYYERDRGRMLVVWTEGDSRMMYRYRYDDGIWSTPVYVSNQDSSEMPRMKYIFNYNGMEYLVWSDGVYKLYLGAAPDGFGADNMKARLIEDPGGGYFSGYLDREGVLHLVWSCEGPDSPEDYDIYYDDINLNGEK